MDDKARIDALLDALIQQRNTALNALADSIAENRMLQAQLVGMTKELSKAKSEPKPNDKVTQ